MNEAVRPWTLVVVVDAGVDVVVVVDTELGPLELPQPTPASVSQTTTAACRTSNDRFGAIAGRAER